MSYARRHSINVCPGNRVRYTQQRGGPLHELVRALESMGADVWEPFARNNQIGRASAGWAHRIG